jgi:glycosyltransferase involved in cell wall biosynthesis
VNIAIISLYYKPIWPGYGTRSTQLYVDQATNVGNDITVFTGRIPKEFKVEKRYREKISKENIGNGSLQIHRLWGPNFKHEGLIKRTLVYSLFLFECFFKILFSKKLDIIIGMHPYPPFFIPIILLSKLKKIKFVMEEADLWPDVLWELKIIKNKFVYDVISKFSVWSYKLSDLVLVITDEIKEGLDKYLSKSNVKVLSLAVDTNLFHPTELTKKNPNKKFTVMYNGILSPNYDFDIILNSAELINNSDIEFIIAGKGELKNKIIDKIHEKKLQNIVVEDPVETMEEVVLKLNRADVLILGMHDYMQAKTAHPSKLFEFMACGKPIVCSCKGAPRRLLEAAKAGILVEPQNYKEFSDAIMSIYNSHEYQQVFGSNGRKFVESNFSLSAFEIKLQTILKKLL